MTMMLDFTSEFVSFSSEEVVTALYYVARYIKQAAFFKHEKDIFEDVERSVPSEREKTLACSIISVIENHFGKKIADLDRNTVVDVLRLISAVEQEIEPSYTAEEVSAANEALKSMGLPPGS
jgi:hypothetical protein